MPEAADLQQISPSLWLWQAFDPAVKSDLFSTAVLLGGQLFFIDPIPLEAGLLKELTAAGDVGIVLVTNGNHLRAAADFGRALKTTIFAAATLQGEFGSARTQPLASGEPLAPGVTAIALEGAAPGEMAFHFADAGGTLVVGDALIHFEPYGFTFLPAKYCSDQDEMRRSLRQLFAWPFERLFFAHGTPILSGARARLEALLR